MVDKAKLQKGKVQNIKEMAVDLGSTIAREGAKVEPTGILDKALKIIEHPVVKPLVQQGIQMLMQGALGIGTPAPVKSAGAEQMSHSPEGMVRPRSPSHELLFKQLNGLPEEVISQVTPFLTKILSGDVLGALADFKKEFGGMLGLE